MGGGKRSGRGKASKPFIPLWLVVVLVVVLVAAALLRLKVVPPRKAIPRPRPSQSKTQPHAQPPQPYEPEEPAPAHRNENGTPTARPAPKPPPSPGGITTVSVVIDDVGYRLDLVEEAAASFPHSVTFAVIPFLPESEASARYLHDHGFPVILHTPMEPEHPERWRPTPGTLTVGMSKTEVDNVLAADLKAVPFAEGINNHMGSLATADRQLMESVAENLKRRGLYFLDSRTSAHTVAYDTAQSERLPSAFRSVFLDDVDEEGAIIKQFDLLVARAEKEGILVAIGHLRPKTIAVLSKRIPYWSARGVRFVPLREVVH